MADVRLENVSKTYGDVIAVDKLNMVTEERELLVLLGPSGCGKTTTLRLVAGLETPDSGSILIDGEVVNEIPPKERDVAMVFQSYALFPHKTVFDNIGFPLKMRKTPNSETARAVHETAELLRIEHLLARKPAELSGGEQQRVAVARAIVRKPKVFLMDEPLSNLDAKLRLQVRAELKALQKELEITTVYVTHDQIEAMTLADRIALLDRGKLSQLASPMEIYRRPANQFVAGFIGTPPTNLIDCTMIVDGQKNILSSVDLHIECGEIGPILKERATSNELTIGIHAEDISINRMRNPNSRNAIKGRVYVVEPLGAESIVDLQIGEQLVKVKAQADFTMNRGEEVWVDFDARHMHVFDGKTQQLIV